MHPARRFFRLFKWIDCWNIAYSQFDSKSDANDGKINVKRAQAPQDSLHFLLVFAKWSLLGVYLFLEMFTIVDAVTGTWRPWAVTAQLESLKLWFYALSVSVVLDLYEIFVVYPELATSPATKPGAAAEKPASERARENKNEEANPDTQAVSTRAAKRRALYRQLVIDGCDALIPGATVGWLGLDPVTVGAVGTISAIVGGSDAWVRVNS